MSEFFLLASDPDAVQNLSIFDPASPSAASIRSLSLLVAAISAFIFIIVEGVLIYSVARFRGRSGPPASEPPQVYGSKAIEIAWTAAPALIVFILVLVVTRTLWAVNRPNPEPKPGDQALYVTVIGHQWWWEYVYDSYDGRKLGTITANELHAPASGGGVDRPVYLTLKSADVCHSFWLPRLGGKTDLIPGHPNEMWFQTDKPGLYLGQCAEYCGTQHANMLLRVIVDEPADFERWLENESELAVTPAAGDRAATAAQSTFLAQSCVNCHRVRGTRADGKFGPDLTHLMARQTLASGMVTNDRETLRQWLLDPQNIKPGCLMPAFGLQPREIDSIVEYLLTLK
ncbi:MAG: cytochrome c oxidase subunit II [Planctomycetia bacterium 21-64-5]|nr:MAG: cytochrome c oxidase subunit II [Planctomycetia bacterium 21-64-5]HQU47212.1 cytochrome c oxidase subunit II [Pirellulales bacterium]